MVASTAHQRTLDALPQDWETCTVGDLGTIVGGSTPSRGAARFWGGPFPWITPGELTLLATKHVWSTRESISRAGLDSCGARLVPEGTLLVTSRATLGSVALAGVALCTNQGFKSVVFSGATSPDFYFHLFKTLTSELQRRASGTTFLEIPGREFSAVIVPRPPFPEQRQIAAVLDTLDDAIRETEQIIAKLKQVKQGLLHDLLTRGIDDNGEMRDPERHPELFQDSPLGRIPKVWTVEKLADVAEISKLAGFEFTSHVRYRDDGEMIAIRPLNIKNERIDLSDIQRVKRSVSDALPRSKARAGDVVVTYIGAYIGEAALIEDDDKFHLAPNIARVRPARFSSKLLVWLIRSPLVQRQFRRWTSTTATPSMTMASLRRTMIVVPEPPEQARMAEAIRSAHERQLAEERLATQLRATKVGLVSDLLSGRVRVTGLLPSVAQ